ncbi:MAG: serine/threonine-protein kinase [Myxococcota bacterium]
MTAPSSVKERRQLARHALQLRIDIENVRTRGRVRTTTGDFHSRGVFVQVLPPDTVEKDTLHVSFVDAPSPGVCVAQCQHADARGAGLSLKEVPESTRAFLRSLTSAGLTIDGYRLTHYLSSGGMAQVYLAQHPSGVPVVLKRLLPHFAREPSALELFTSEAELLRRCDHAGLPKFHDVKQLDDVFFLAMEWISGFSLDSTLERFGALPVPAARAILLQLLRTLDYLHHLPISKQRTLSVHHGDISPQNIMLTPDGRVVLIDLGACSSDLTPRPPGFEILGTLPYMAPEIINGHQPHTASELWSVGCVFFEMLTGVRPFEGEDDFETVELITTGVFDTPHVEDYGPLDEQILRRTLAPRAMSSRDFGYETARDLVDTLLERSDELSDRRALRDYLAQASRSP